MRRPERLAALLLAPLALLAAGCGGDDDSAGDVVRAEGGAVTIVSDRLAFDVELVEAPVGTLHITHDNQDDGVPHNIAVTGNGVDEATELEKGSVVQELTVELPEPGVYTFVCAIHPRMVGTIRAISTPAP